MSLGSLDVFYILLIEKCAKRKDLHSQSKKEEILRGGTLLRLLRRTFVKTTTTQQEPQFLLEKKGDSEVQVICVESEIAKLSWEIPYIEPIIILKERLEVFKDKDWLNIGKKLRKGDPVYVKVKDEQVEGIVMFKDEVSEAKGVIYGVKLSVSCIQL